MTQQNTDVPVSHYGDRYVGIFGWFGSIDFTDAFCIMHADSFERAEEMMREHFGAKWSHVLTWSQWMDEGIRDVFGAHRVRLVNNEWMHDRPIRTAADLFGAYK